MTKVSKQTSGKLSSLDRIVTPERRNLQELLQTNFTSSRRTLPVQVRREFGFEFLPTPMCNLCNAQGHWTSKCAKVNLKETASKKLRHTKPGFSDSKPIQLRVDNNWSPSTSVDKLVDVEVIDPYKQFYRPLKFPDSLTSMTKEEKGDEQVQKTPDASKADRGDRSPQESKEKTDTEEVADILCALRSPGVQNPRSRRGPQRKKRKSARRTESDTTGLDALISPARSKQSTISSFMRAKKRSPKRPLSADASGRKRMKNEKGSPPNVFTFESKMGSK
eukprot:CAMPEP_0184482882 /NCGR_PEP_ID=MMETSP0113_2-20130426/4476_1 /TAXON_ID=91329 /ORGANISM="Norrisiella sphaerica, Strain BC52" /LENGTH=276 /DNA_ID=CAMNT_0026862899 /DNA_START=75 /DNA_END=905 /DNA_ORIENTATION=+